MSLKKSSIVNDELISVFTVNWNGAKWLKRYFSSLKSQTYKNIEMLLVDNNSTDNSVDYVRKNFPMVKIIKNKKNVGLAQATNIGINACKGEHVMFINNDTWFEKDYVEKMFVFFKKNSYTAIAPVEKRYYDRKKFICNTTIDPTGSPAFYIPTYSKKNKIFYLTVSFLCKKSDYNSTGGMDKDFFMYYEDVDWFWRLTLAGKRFTVTNTCKVYHAGAGSSGAGLKYNTFLWRNQNTLQALIKNYSGISLFLVLPFYFLQNIVEMVFFLLIGKGNISTTYIKGWIYNIKILKKTIKKRKKIQNTRTVSDLEVLGKMYPGVSKLQLLKVYFIDRKKFI